MIVTCEIRNSERHVSELTAKQCPNDTKTHISLYVRCIILSTSWLPIVQLQEAGNSFWCSDVLLPPTGAVRDETLREQYSVFQSV